jgi:hypothetical protein
MNLTVERGPLDRPKNEVILAHYNRLSSSRIPIEEYLHWVENSPSGPAWHAILENEEHQVVGHSALIPFPGRYNGKDIVAGKAEYAFILEEYQAAKIRGLENKGSPRNALMIHRLFEHAKASGLGPLLISTNPTRRRSLWSIGAATLEIPVCECLLVLRPWKARGSTPNLKTWQRGALWLGGLLQAAAWSLGSPLATGPQMSAVRPAAENAPSNPPHTLRFFEDRDSLLWRYGSRQYAQLVLRGSDECVIFKKGSEDRYLRVCEWRLGGEQPTFSTVAKLVRLAKRQNALGIRWAVYGNACGAMELRRRLKALGFLCALRNRRLLVDSPDQEVLEASKWQLSDGMFSFDP